MRPAVIAQVAIATALGALISSFAGAFVAVQTLDARSGLVLRAVLVTLVLLLAGWFLVRPRVLSATRRALRLTGLTGLAVGYLLAPSTWNGRAYAAQLLAEPGTTTVVLDLVLWLVVGGAAVVAASAPASAREPATY